MAAITTWWSPEQAIGLGRPAEPQQQLHDGPRRGAFGGQCHHVTCAHTGADWFNKSNGRYYCDSCARAINEICLDQGELEFCELHI